MVVSMVVPMAVSRAGSSAAEKVVSMADLWVVAMVAPSVVLWVDLKVVLKVHV